MSQGGSAQAGGSSQANPMVSGSSPYKAPFTNTAPGMMGGMGGSATPSFAPQAPVAMEQPKLPTGPFTNTAPGMMGGMGGPADTMNQMPPAPDALSKLMPYDQYKALPPQLQQTMAQHGGKGGMPGGQPMQQQAPWMKTPMQQQTSPQAQGLAALMDAQQKAPPSTNSLQ